ncbi:MAG: hypothetical protein K2M41_03005 [Muribaculaceae bacterium]|nr:hypothetical protein [Muribaculaceae bacterium]
MLDVKKYIGVVKQWLSRLGFRTGLIVLGFCILFYILSFAQMALPISATLKGTLWVILFGMAKATQYTALLILGKEGIIRLKRLFNRTKTYE